LEEAPAIDAIRYFASTAAFMSILRSRATIQMMPPVGRAVVYHRLQ
jgi:hypothetical protein